MSYVFAAPEYVAAAATDLADLGSTIDSARMAASGPTASIVAAAEDEVSAAVAAVFSGHARSFQLLGAQAGLFHSSFAQALRSGGNLYATAEAANASIAATAASFTDVGGAPFSPFLLLTGRALFGNGANGAADGAKGGDGGLIIGNGGNGTIGHAGQAGGDGGAAGLIGNGGNGGMGGLSADGGRGGAGGVLFGNGGNGGASNDNPAGDGHVGGNGGSAGLFGDGGKGGVGGDGDHNGGHGGNGGNAGTFGGVGGAGGAGGVGSDTGGDRGQWWRRQAIRVGRRRRSRRAR